MKTHPEIVRVRRLLDSCRGHWPVVAERAGVSHSWLSKFSRGEMDNPGVLQLHKVAVACERIARKMKPQ